MITKYTLIGTVRNTGKVVTKYVSAPKGISTDEIAKALRNFRTAFENVKMTINI